MHKKLIKRKIYKKYGLDYKKINNELKDHIDRFSSSLRTYYELCYRMDNFNKVNIIKN